MTQPEAWSTLLGISRRPETAKELAARGALVGSLLAGAEERVFSVPVLCRTCQQVYAHLPEGGICIDCQAVTEANALVELRLAKMLGKWAKEHYTLASFSTPTEGHEDIKRRVLKFRPTTDNLFLQGAPGSGKTHLAAALLQEWAGALKGSVGFWRSTDLMRSLRGLQGHEEALQIKAVAQKRLLVIDDIGVGKATEFVLQVLYDIVEERISQGLAGLVITSNLKLDEIAKRLKDDRLSSRIAGLCEVIHIDLPDWRGKPYQEDML